MTPLLPDDDSSASKVTSPALEKTVPADVNDGLASVGSGRGLGMRSCRLATRFALLLLCMGMLYLPGCGGGIRTFGFDGGGFPIGGRVYGVVVAADKPSAAVANATVNVLSIARTGETRTQEITTDIHGQFDFPAVPLSSPIGQIRLTVTPKVGSDRQVQHLAFTVTNGQTANLIVALPPKTFDPSIAVSLALEPPYIQVNSVDNISIKANLLDSAGKSLNIMPSLLFFGNFGYLGSDGSTFFSNSAGPAIQNSTLTAMFDLGNNTQLQVSNAVTASPKIGQHPPPPPILPAPPLDTEPPIILKGATKIGFNR